MVTRIKAEREKRKMEQKELASLLGLAVPTLGNYEAGRREPPLDVLCAIADLFDVSLDMLIRGKEKDRPVERSMDEMLATYRKMSEEQLMWFIAVMQAALADKRFQAHLRQDGKADQ